MNKSQFFEMIKSLKSKPDAVVLVMNTIYVSKDSEYMKEFLSCKTEKKAATEFNKFNRWLAEALEKINPSETSWRPESNMLKPGHYEAKVKSVNLEDGKITISAEVGEAVLNLPVRTHICCEETEEERQLLANGDYNRFELFGVDGFKSCTKCHECKMSERLKGGGKTEIIEEMIGCGALPKNIIKSSWSFKGQRVTKKQKSPEKIYIRATVKILKRYDCFDSAKNPHWSNMSKKQKKYWARKFALEILEADIYHMAHDLCVDGVLGFNEGYNLHYKEKARQQIIDELDAEEVEDSIEENLNCLW